MVRYCVSESQSLCEFSGFIQITHTAPEGPLQTTSEVEALQLNNNFTRPYHIKKKDIDGDTRKTTNRKERSFAKGVMIDVFISSSFSSSPLSLSLREGGAVNQGLNLTAVIYTCSNAVSHPVIPPPCLYSGRNKAR